LGLPIGHDDDALGDERVRAYYGLFKSLAEVCLEDSWVLEVDERGGSLVFDLEVVLTERHAFSVLAGQSVTNTGPTVVGGDLGVSPGSSVTGFPPGTVLGTTHVADAAAATAQTDLTTAYNDPSAYADRLRLG
jgi:ice-binding like protein